MSPKSTRSTRNVPLRAGIALLLTIAASPIVTLGEINAKGGVTAAINAPPPQSTQIPRQAQDVGTQRAALAAKSSTESGARQRVILDAKPPVVSPSVISPDSRIQVDLQVFLAIPVAAEELEDALVIFVNGQQAESLPPPPAVQLSETEKSQSTSIAKVSSKGEAKPASNERSLTLFARVPHDMPSGEQVPLVIYSRLDGHDVARVDVLTAKPDVSRAVPTTSPTDTGFPWKNQLRTIVLASSLLTLFVGALIYLLLRRSSEKQLASLEQALSQERARLNQAYSASAPATQPPSAYVEEPIPTQASVSIPDALLTSLSRGELCLVVGSGLPADAGLPTGSSLWLSVIDRLKDLPTVGAARQQLMEVMRRNGADAVIEPLIALVGRERLLAQLVEELASGRNVSNPQRAGDALADLSAMGVRRYLDLNWDPLLESSLNQKRVSVYTGQESASLSEALRGPDTIVIKPYGTAERPDTLILTPHDFRRKLSVTPELERVLGYLLSTQTLLFVGLDTGAIERFLSGLPAQLESSGREHFAYVPKDYNTDLWSQGFAKRFGITVLPVDSGVGSSVRAVLKPLTERARDSQPSSKRASLNRPPLPGLEKIRTLHLENIGNFISIDIKFADSWTLFLGDNGGGKSTILRAITLALAGNDPRGEAMAARLLRMGERTGAIDLTLGSSGGLTLKTRLTRDGNRVVVSAAQITPLQASQGIVLGFPAVRGVTTTQSTGPTRMSTPEPSVDDVLPLLQEKIDTRLNQLKQWVINTAIQSEDKPDSRQARMFSTFRQILRDVVPGRQVEYSHIDRETWTVYLKTEDGVVSFDSLSQGTSSILAWVGILLQRLYDTYPSSDSPEKSAALVLIDEIDAHLHPRWQRKLVALTRRQFPNIQMICSSHSPLLAGAVNRREVRIVERNPKTGRSEANEPAEDVSGQRVDDILTSSLFALTTTRSPEAEQKIKEYFVLFEKFDRTPDENLQLEALEEELDKLNYGPSGQAKARQQTLRTTLTTQLDSIPKDLTGPLAQRLAAGRSLKPGEDDESSELPTA